MKKKLLATGFGLSLVVLVTACQNTPSSSMPTHVVCHSGGVRILDDFGKRALLSNAGISYTSDTTRNRAVVTGDCAAFNDTPRDGWKPLLPGMSKDVQP